MSLPFSASRTNASTQPWLPQLQRGPAGSIVKCPSSPARPSRPSCGGAPHDEAATHTRTDDEEDGRVASAGGAQRPLGERECARIVDQPHGGAEPVADRAGDGAAVPVAGDVDEEGGGAERVVEEAGNADADRIDLPRLPAGGDEPLDHRFRAGGGAGFDLTARRDLAVLEHDPFHVGAAEVEPEVPHRIAQPPSTVRTAPVTNGAVAR